MKRWACMLCHNSDVPHRKRDICEDCVDGLEVRGLAWCPRGKHRVEASAISPVHGAPCRACFNAGRRAKNDPVKNSERSRSWRTRNPDRVRTYKRAYDRRMDVQARRKARRQIAYERNPERIRAQWRAQYQRHATYRREWERAYRIKNRDRMLMRYRVYREQQKLKILQSWRRTA